MTVLALPRLVGQGVRTSVFRAKLWASVGFRGFRNQRQAFVFKDAWEHGRLFVFPPQAVRGELLIRGHKGFQAQGTPARLGSSGCSPGSGLFAAKNNGTLRVTRISIDCSPLLVRSAGVRTWLRGWLGALRESGGVSVGTILEPAGNGSDLNERQFAHPFQLAVLQMLRRLPAGAGAMNAVTAGADVFHASNFMRAAPARVRLSATLHDLTAWTVPECHRRAQIAADRMFAERILRRADGLIAVSEHTRKDAVEILGIRPEKIAVIYPGVAEEYFSVTEGQKEAAASAKQITRPYFLFVGTIEPRKNLTTLLDAWMLLPVEVRRSTELIVAGMRGWECDRILRRLSQMQKDDTGVRYLGYVEQRYLAGLTGGALALVYPSWYEGFGLPVAQAMACGCPVVVSNVSALPEIAGGAGLLADPRSAGEIAGAMLRIVESAAVRAGLAAAGIERADLFRWPRAAAESVRFFRDLAG